MRSRCDCCESSEASPDRCWSSRTTTPDPDAIASALGLARIAESVGIPADACYGGEIAHQENRAMVNLLDLSLRTFDGIDLDDYGGSPSSTTRAPGSTTASRRATRSTSSSITIHRAGPWRGVRGHQARRRRDEYADRRVPLTGRDRAGPGPRDRPPVRDPDRHEGLHAGDVDPGLRSGRVAVVPHADESTLERVESPSVSPETLRVLARAIEGRDVRGSTVASCVGEIGDRDAPRRRQSASSTWTGSR